MCSYLQPDLPCLAQGQRMTHGWQLGHGQEEHRSFQRGWGCVCGRENHCENLQVFYYYSAKMQMVLHVYELSRMP